MNAIVNLTNKTNAIFKAIPVSIVLLLVRIGIFYSTAFYASGKLKWDGWFELSRSAKFLFGSEFKLNIFGAVYDMPFPNTSAFLAGIGEIVLPLAILIGFASRLSALGLIIMTIVIQLIFPDAWKLHFGWSVYFMVILVMGPGKISVDHLLAGFFKK
ncbi:MAG: DoxX family protein [Devosiaceae bacterium]|nr:DoxX family protein [Devosiaceae bacterium]